MINVYCQEKKRKTLVIQVPGTPKNLRTSEVREVLEFAIQECPEDCAKGTLTIDGMSFNSLLRRYLQSKGINA